MFKVGHVYRSRTLPHPYSYPKGVKATLACNNRRAAEIWLDEFKVLYDMNLSKTHMNLGNNMKLIIFIDCTVKYIYKVYLLSTFSNNNILIYQIVAMLRKEKKLEKP